MMILSKTNHDYCNKPLKIPDKQSNANYRNRGDWSMIWQCYCPYCNIVVWLTTEEIKQAHKDLKQDG